MENQIIELSDKEAFEICLEINNQIIALTASNAKVIAKFNQYKTIKSELEFFSSHYHGRALNDLLQNLLVSFEALEKEVLTNKTQYENLYGKGSSDGYV